MCAPCSWELPSLLSGLFVIVILEKVLASQVDILLFETCNCIYIPQLVLYGLERISAINSCSYLLYLPLLDLLFPLG